MSIRGGGCGCCCTIRIDSFPPYLGELKPSTDYFTYTPGDFTLFKPNPAVDDYWVKASMDGLELRFYNNRRSVELTVDVFFSGISIGDEFILHFDTNSMSAKMDPIPVDLESVYGRGTGIIVTNTIDSSIGVVPVLTEFNELTYDPNSVYGTTLEILAEDCAEATGLPCSYIRFTPSDLNRTNSDGIEYNFNLPSGDKEYGFEVALGYERVFFDNMNFTRRAAGKCECGGLSCNELSCGSLPNTLYMEINGLVDTTLYDCEFDYTEEAVQATDCDQINTDFMTEVENCRIAAGALGCSDTFYPCNDKCEGSYNAPFYPPECDTTLIDNPYDCYCWTMKCAFESATMPDTTRACCFDRVNRTCDVCANMNGIIELVRIPNTCIYESVEFFTGGCDFGEITTQGPGTISFVPPPGPTDSLGYFRATLASTAYGDCKTGGHSITCIAPDGTTIMQGVFDTGNPVLGTCGSGGLYQAVLGVASGYLICPTSDAGASGTPYTNGMSYTNFTMCNKLYSGDQIICCSGDAGIPPPTIPGCATWKIYG